MLKVILLTIFSCVSFIMGVGQCTFASIDTSGMECTSARFLCGSELDGYSGTLGSSITPGIQPANYCGTSSPENIEWYSFLVSDPMVEITITFSGCSGGLLPDQGFQAGVYSSCNFVDDDVICVSQSMTSGVINLTFTTIPGIHYLFLDGFAGSVCDYSVDVISGVCIDPFDALNNPDLECRPVDTRYPDSTIVTVCQGNLQSLRPDLDFPPVFDFCDINELNFNELVDGQPFFCVETIVNNSMGYEIISGEEVSVNYTSPKGTIFSDITSIRWDSIGTYEVRQNIFVNPYLPSCYQFDTICSEYLTVIVEPFDTVQMQVDTICEGDNYLFCGSSFSSSDELICRDDENCSIIIQPLFVQSRVDVQLDTIYICNNGCYEIYDNLYCNPGQYSDFGTAFCDTNFIFTVDVLDIDITITGDSLITCDNPSVVLTANYTSNFNGVVTVMWTDIVGATVGIGETLTTSSNGTYTFMVIPEGYEICKASRTVEVTKDDNIPILTINPPQISCFIPLGNIQTSSDQFLVSYDWIGPNLFSSMDSTPSISDPGLYSLSVIAENGCKVDTTFLVEGDFDEPDIDLTFDSLDCSILQGEASFLSNAGISNNWTLPNSIEDPSPSINYTTPGLYTLSVFGSNGCQSDTTFTVVDLSFDPSIGIDLDTLWRCSTTEINYGLNIPSNLTVMWTNIGGDFESNGSSLIIKGPGTYVATINDSSTGCVGTDTLSIIDDREALKIQFEINDPTCFGESNGSIIPVFSSIDRAPYLISINGKAVVQDDLQNLSAGTYTIKIVDNFGCQIDTLLEISSPEVISITSPSEIIVKFGTDVELTVTHNISDGRLAGITWFDMNNFVIGQGETITITGEEVTTYGVLIQDTIGCTDSLAINIVINGEIDVFVPSIFSPNNDGANDVWFLSANGYPNNIAGLKIFSRWGELVFDKNLGVFNDPSFGWDGTYNGKSCQPGVYVFLVQYLDINGDILQKEGTITLIR